MYHGDSAIYYTYKFRVIFKIFPFGDMQRKIEKEKTALILVIEIYAGTQQIIYITINREMQQK